MQQFYKLLQPVVEYLHQNINIKIINKTVCIITLDSNLIFDEIDIHKIEETIRKQQELSKLQSSKIKQFQSGQLQNRLKDWKETKKSQKFTYFKPINKEQLDYLQYEGARIIQTQIRVYLTKCVLDLAEPKKNICPTIFLCQHVIKLKNFYIVGTFNLIKQSSRFLLKIKNSNLKSKKILREWEFDFSTISPFALAMSQDTLKVTATLSETLKIELIRICGLAWKLLHFEIIHDSISVSSRNQNRLVLEEPTVKVKEDKKEFSLSFELITKIKYKIQQFLAIQLKKVKLKAKQLHLQQEQEKGKTMKRGIKKFGSTYYDIIIYAKENYYTVIAFNRFEHNYNKLRSFYTLHNSRGMVNSFGLDMPDFIFSIMEIYDNQINFKEENYQLLSNYQECFQNNEKSVSFQSQNLESTPMSPSQSMNSISNIEPTQEKKILYQFQKQTYDNQYQFNIVYHPDKVILILSILQTVSQEEKKANYEALSAQSARLRRLKQSEQTVDKDKNKNLLTIDIDIEALKKYNPQLKIKSSADLTMIAENLTSVIDFDRDGNIRIDNQKLNPLCLKVTHQHQLKSERQQIDQLANINKYEEPIKASNQKDDVKKVINKAIKLSEDTKYLIVINYIERSVSNLLKELNQNEVFEEFEILFEIALNNITQKDKPVLLWEIPIAIIYQLTGMNNNYKASQILLNKLSVFDQKLILEVFKHEQLYIIHPPHVILICEKTLKLIQLKFKNRKFLVNFQQFKLFLHQNGQFILKKFIYKQLKSFYLVMIYENQGNLIIGAWDMITYNALQKFVMKFSFFDKFGEESKRSLLTQKMQSFIKLEYNSKIGTYSIKFDKLLCKDELEKNKSIQKIRKLKYDSNQLQSDEKQNNTISLFKKENQKNLKLQIEH